ncbi:MULTISPECIES: hypothetical protein [Candidatus Ichthyocystis]|nr:MULTISPECIES: hypothetical protein [Ichthyocystis]
MKNRSARMRRELAKKERWGRKQEQPADMERLELELNGVRTQDKT